MVSSCVDGILVPQGKRAQFLTVVVDESMQWGSIVSDRRSNIVSGIKILKIGALYSPGDIGPIEKTVVLVSLGDGTSLRAALVWGSMHGLLPAGPRTVFASAKKYRHLPRMFGGATLTIVSPQERIWLGTPVVPVVTMRAKNGVADMKETGCAFERSVFAFERPVFESVK